MENSIENVKGYSSDIFNYLNVEENVELNVDKVNENINKFVEKFHRLLNTQNEFNANFPGWENGFVSSTNKVVDWRRYIRKESNEATERLPYAHWKNVDQQVTELNIIEIQMEVVDILHFMLSESIKQLHVSGIKDNILQSIDAFKELAIIKENGDLNLNTFSIQGLYMIYYSFKAFDNKSEYVQWINSNHNYYEVIKAFELLESLTYSTPIDPFHYFEALGVVLNNTNMNFDYVFKLYYGKNALNKFRFNNGYKEGNYRKLWDGIKEDNLFLQDILDNMEDEEFDSDDIINTIYNKLQELYEITINNSAESYQKSIANFV